MCTNRADGGDDGGASPEPMSPGASGGASEGAGDEGAEPHRFSVADRVTALTLPLRVLFESGGPKGLHLKRPAANAAA